MKPKSDSLLQRASGADAILQKQNTDVEAQHINVPREYLLTAGLLYGIILIRMT